MDSVEDLMGAVRESDAVVIITNHKSYDYESILKESSFIFDARNALGQSGRGSPKVERL
jgi:UDP-N-acetyl-D-mannosaminuronate dehydrogenase